MHGQCQINFTLPQCGNHLAGRLIEHFDFQPRMSAPQHGQSRPKILLDGRSNVANPQSFTFSANQPADFSHAGIVICQKRFCPFSKDMSSIRGTHPGRCSFQNAPTELEFE